MTSRAACKPLAISQILRRWRPRLHAKQSLVSATTATREQHGTRLVHAAGLALDADDLSAC